MWSTSLLASGVASFVPARTSELPIWTEPPATWLRPVPEPPPLTVIVAPGHAASYFFAAASTSGCSAVEPAAVMLPVTQLRLAAALAPVLALADDEAAEGDDPVDEHAVTTSRAATARAPNRRVPFSNVVSPLPLRQWVVTTSPRYRLGSSEPALNGALVDC